MTASFTHTVEHSGIAFGAAWQNVLEAAGQDDARPILYRSVLVELYGNSCVRLTATDSYMLFTTVVGDGVAVDDLKRKPVDSFVVRDPDQRGIVVAKWAHKQGHRARQSDADPLNVRLTKRPADRDALTLDVGQQVFVMETPDEWVALDIMLGEYPAWRHLMEKHTPKMTKQVNINPEFLARVGKLREVSFTAGAPLVLGGKEGPVRLQVEGTEYGGDVLGLIMPVKDHRS